MTPTRAVVEAVLRHVPVLEPGIAQQIAADVLAAFFAGEVEGEWGATWYQPSYADHEFPFVYQQDGKRRTMHWSMPSMGQARRVAHALNWREE